MWILYLEEVDIFLWDWVSNIVRSAEFKHGLALDDIKASTISFRFVRELNGSVFEEVYRTAYQEHQEIKKINMLLWQATSTIVAIGRNPETGEVETSNEAIVKIKTHGISLSNQGSFTPIQEWLQSVPTGYGSTDPDFQVIVGYSCFRSGDYSRAWTMLRYIDVANVRADFQDICEFMVESLRFALGFGSLEDYHGKLQILEERNPQTTLGIILRLERLRRKLTQENWNIDNRGDAVTLVAEIEQLASATHAPGCDPVLKAMSEIITADAEMQVHLRQLLASGLRFKFLGRSKDHSEQVEEARKAIQGFQKWVQRYESIMNDPNIPKKYRAQATVSYVRALLIGNANLNAISGAPVGRTPGNYHPLLNTLAEAHDVFVELGDGEQQLLSDLVRAEIYDTIGDRINARQLAETVRIKAEHFGLKPIINQANKFLSGQTISEVRELVNNRPSADQILLKMSEEHRQHCVASFSETMDISVTEAEKALDWLRADGEERTQYCQFIRTESVLLRTQIHFFYRCGRYNYGSRFPQREREPLLRQFKADYCLGCSWRTPNITPH